MVYAGFWRRIAATLIDVLIFFVFAYPSAALAVAMHLPYLVFALIALLIGAWYEIHIVRKYGGTIGKLVVGIRIVMLNGENATLYAAFKRYVITLTFAILTYIAYLLAILSTDEGLFSGLGELDRKKLIALAPSWYGLVESFGQIWIWSEFITMLFNKKRRAIHDFMGGTVVIRTEKPVASESV